MPTTPSISSQASAIIVLAIMILPTIINISENAISAVPSEYREASYGLGATKIQTIFKVVIPAAKSGIASGVVLGVGRAIGEAMAIILVAGNSANMPELFSSVKFLTTGIQMWYLKWDTQPDFTEKHSLRSDLCCSYSL